LHIFLVPALLFSQLRLARRKKILSWHKDEVNYPIAVLAGWQTTEERSASSEKDLNLEDRLGILSNMRSSSVAEQGSTGDPSSRDLKAR
jgi:hypothetical protein